jgi:hypothetical protein
MSHDEVYRSCTRGCGAHSAHLRCGSHCVSTVLLREADFRRSSRWSVQKSHHGDETSRPTVWMRRVQGDLLNKCKCGMLPSTGSSVQQSGEAKEFRDSISLPQSRHSLTSTGVDESRDLMGMESGTVIWTNAFGMTRRVQFALRKASHHRQASTYGGQAQLAVRASHSCSHVASHYSHFIINTPPPSHKLIASLVLLRVEDPNPSLLAGHQRPPTQIAFSTRRFRTPHTQRVVLSDSEKASAYQRRWSTRRSATFFKSSAMKHRKIFNITS